MCSRHTLGLLLLKTALQHNCNLKYASQQSSAVYQYLPSLCHYLFSIESSRNRVQTVPVKLFFFLLFFLFKISLLKHLVKIPQVTTTTETERERLLKRTERMLYTHTLTLHLNKDRWERCFMPASCQCMHPCVCNSAGTPSVLHPANQISPNAQNVNVAFSLQSTDSYSDRKCL